MTTVVVGAAVLGGCSGDDGGPKVASDPPSVPGPAPSDATDDAGICDAYGDVLTIVENADIALADGRMDAQEQHGWYGPACLDACPGTAAAPCRQRSARSRRPPRQGRPRSRPGCGPPRG